MAKDFVAWGLILAGGAALLPGTVLAAGASLPSPAGMRSAPTTGMATATRILVPTDFSAPADDALTYALALAEKLGATIALVHVFEDPNFITMYSEQYVPMPEEMRRQVLADIHRRLANRVARCGHIDATSLMLTGPIAQTIVDGGRNLGADLIVMGTHGRHGMAHLLLGSVAERVVRTALCPVLTVRSPSAGDETPVAEHHEIAGV